MSVKKRSSMEGAAAVGRQQATLLVGLPVGRGRHLTLFCRAKGSREIAVRILHGFLFATRGTLRSGVMLLLSMVRHGGGGMGWAFGGEKAWLCGHRVLLE